MVFKCFNFHFNIKNTHTPKSDQIKKHFNLIDIVSCDLKLRQKTRSTRRYLYAERNKKTKYFTIDTIFFLQGTCYEKNLYKFIYFES